MPPTQLRRLPHPDGLRAGFVFLLFAVLQYFLSESVVSVLTGSREFARLVHVTQVVVMVGAAVVVIAARQIAKSRAFQRIAVGVAWVFTTIFLLKIVELSLGLDQARQPEAGRLLVDAGLLWVNNAMIFATWYWLLDSGGDSGRQRSADDRRVDLLFPQEASPVPGYRGWTPNFFDYLYVAFCINTTLGPSDTIALSWRTKVLVMLQASASVIILSVIAARAIGIVE
jgi:hypothetical protein